MCSPQRQPLGEFWENLRQPGPLDWKVRRFLANMSTKVLRWQVCCGRPGEPGC
jgi:hypothetical protein